MLIYLPLQTLILLLQLLLLEQLQEEFIREMIANISSLVLLLIMMVVLTVGIEISEDDIKDDLISGNKFVIKQVTGVRKQFLILNGEIILGFVTKGKKFANCSSYTEVTASVDCKVCRFTGKYIRIPHDPI